MTTHSPKGFSFFSKTGGRFTILLVLLLQIAASVVAVVPRAYAATVTLPDMQIKVPTNAISIGTNSSNGHRQLQFTHITWDGGPGPIEMDPTYNSATGTASFTQAIYNSPSPGTWTFDHSVPLAVTGVFDPPSDYQFPLTEFTLNNVNADGSLGGAVAISPKTDYCMTADVFVGGVPNEPNQTFIPAGNCDDPTKPLGWSSGWGDQYDQTDAGQPIDLTGIADGTYILHALVDPLHVLTESDPTNNVVDTKLQISGGTVTVLSQSSPITTPPTVTMTSPANGAAVSGTVSLQANASAAAPATISSVQFLLDGQPLGSPITSAPYTYSWTVGSTPTGNHTLSARATDSSGNVSTAPTETISVMPPTGTISVDRSLTQTGTGTVTTASFSTSAANETLVAFVGGDGPAGSGQQSFTVSGAGLTWKLVKRSNAQSGDSEVWTATASSTLSNVAVTSTPLVGGHDQQLTVLAFQGSGGVGASAAASAASGAPSVSLQTQAAGSLVYAVGNDWTNAVARTLGSGQSMVAQWVDTGIGDTYWAQGTTTVSTSVGQTVTLNDTTPTTDNWNLAAVEVTPSATTPPDTTPPTVSITNPTAGQTVSGTVPVATNATDNVAVSSVQFLLDGQPLGSPITSSPYAISWDTTTATVGAHTLSARATDTSGNTATSASVNVTVQNPAPPMTCFVLQTQVSAHGNGAVTTPSFHTAMAGETLVAFVSADGPRGSGKQSATVSGAGLTWKLVKRSNAQSGDSEVWTATAPSVLTNATVKSTLSANGYSQDLTVIAMEGVKGIGASVAASAASGAPSTNLTTTGATSLVFAVGNDWDNSVARTLPVGWVTLDQWLNTSAGDTYWSQYTNTPTGPAGSVVTVNDTAPTTDSWNMVAVELLNSGN